MSEVTGLDVAAELIKRRNAHTRVIILTTFARPGYLRRALEAGASGYLLKDMPAEKLADAVRRVSRGLRVIDPELAGEAWTEATRSPIANGRCCVSHPKASRATRLRLRSA